MNRKEEHIRFPFEEEKVNTPVWLTNVVISTIVFSLGV